MVFQNVLLYGFVYLLCDFGHGTVLHCDLRSDLGEVICSTTVVALIKTHDLIIMADTENLQLVQDIEHDSRGTTSPSANSEHPQALDTKLTGASTVEYSPVGSISAVRELNIELGGEETDRDNTPSATEEVNWGSIKRIIDLQLLQHEGGSIVDRSSDEADDRSTVWLNDGARSGDGHKTSQNTVQGGSDIGRVSDSAVQGKHSSSTSRGRQGGGDSDLLSDIHVLESKGRARVESIPSEPEDEGAERCNDSRVSGNLDDGSVGTETSSAGAEENGTHKGSTTTSHVDNTGTGEVDHADAA
mmetsp:Transcript_37837/g.45615  ORF Transcript_37837/g.45615 Transcript_37837/m.45615 type:complete len:301 (+) Transcript_37837:173-1075(+)